MKGVTKITWKPSSGQLADVAQRKRSNEQTLTSDNAVVPRRKCLKSRKS